MRIRLVTFLVIQTAVFACGKKHTTDTPPDTATAPAPATASTAAAAINPFADGATQASMGGQLLITSASLAATAPDKVLAVPLIQGTVAAYGDITNYADIKSVDVDATTGRFAVDLPRTDPYLAVIDQLLAESNLTMDDVWSKLPFEMAINFIDTANADLPAALRAYKTKLAAGYGRTWMLVAYNSTGTLATQASSMHFIGLPTTTADLRIVVPGLLKGSLELGNIGIGSTASATAELHATSDALNLSDSAISEIAWVSESLKNVKNSFMNVNLTSKKIILPVMMFDWTSAGLPAANTFSKPANAVYQGYHPRVTAGNFPNMTAAGICASATGHVKLYPPAAVSVSGGSQTYTMGTNAPFTSAAAGALSGTADNGNCDNSATNSSSTTSPNFYANFYDTGTTGAPRIVAEMEWSGDIQGAIPSGLWTFKYDDTTVAQFDMSVTAPITDAKITRVYVPSISFEADATGLVTAVAVKLNYQSADGSWHEISDLSTAARFVSTMEIGFQDSSYSNMLGDNSSDSNSEKLMVTAGTNSFRVTSSSFVNSGWMVAGSTSGKVITKAHASFDLFGQKYSFTFTTP